MMNLTEVKNRLEESFARDPEEGGKRNIIFWYDEEGEFSEDIKELNIDNAKVIELNENNSFQIKYQLEHKDTDSNYLIYSSSPCPKSRENWLLDILKYSQEFSTDKAFLIMRDLGVEDNSLRGAFRKYLKFFNNKERYRKIVSYGITDFTEEKLDIAVLSVLCKLTTADFEQVLKQILIGGEREEENPFLKEIENFGDIDAFWNLVERKYGYSLEEKSLEKLFITLIISYLSQNIEEIPESWGKFVSPKSPDCAVFISNFMHHSKDGKFYDTWANKVENILRVKEYAEKWDIEKFLECDAFLVFDQIIISRIIDNLIEDVGEFEKYRKIINFRRTSHWFEQLHNDYEALSNALEMFSFRSRINKKIKEETGQELFEKYTEDYYQVDKFYRKFSFHYDSLNNKEVFTNLEEKIEKTYTNWFLDEIAIKWTSVLENEFAKELSIPGVFAQKDFFGDFVYPYVSNEERVFVIVSDALRFEAGVELKDLLNRSFTASTEIKPLLGVVPSTTKFGMASLLPKGKFEVSDNGDLLREKVSTQGVNNREKILKEKEKNAVAINYKELADMKTKDYKKLFQGKKLIYIFHDVIDATGDKNQTEKDTFFAVERTFEQLLQLVKNLINYVSATNIIITADHGFIYRRSPLTEVDKINRVQVPVLDSGRRHILTRSNEKMEDTVSISMDYFLGKDSGLYAILPKGVIRYKVQGPGENYVHGGGSLQEITVPLIKLKHERKEKYKAKKVNVKLTSISRKITNRITFLNFFQTEKVDQKRLPLKLKLYFEDEGGKRISNENIIIADSSSTDPQERMHKEKFTLKDMTYYKEKKYYLVLEDEEEAVEKIYDKIPFEIDLLISDDLGF